VSDPLPADTTFVSCTASQGSCSGPAVGLNGTVTANLGTIPFPGFATLSIAVNVTAPGGRTLTNSAVVRSLSPDTNNANNTGTTSTAVSSATSADLRIAKSDSPDPVTSGGTLTYTINVNNDSPTNAAANVIVTDQLPSGVTFVSCSTSPPGLCPSAPVVGGLVTVNLGALPANAIAIVTIQTTVTAAPGSALANSASVTSDTPDPNAANNTATATTSVTPAPSTDLSIAKSDAPDPVFSGNNLTYTITVNNLGPNTANGVEVSDPLPGGTTFVSCVASQGSCTGPAVGLNGTVRALLGTITSAGSATVTIVVNVSAPGNSTLTNSATVLSATPDSNATNNSASATTTVSP
jgi:uncharacterized repeat protein (TIGR01451 family)